MEPILGFVKENRWLSNFESAEVIYEGEAYRTVEHAYMAAKTEDLEVRKFIQGLDTPREARLAGKQLDLRPGWNEMRLEVMEQLNRQKWNIPHLRDKLLATGNAYLEETNWWHDNFWGNCICEGCLAKYYCLMIPGENNLGKIIMKIRDELKELQCDVDEVWRYKE